MSTYTNPVVDDILKWVKSHRENSTLITFKQVRQLFGTPAGMKGWCDKHQLEMHIVENNQYRITNEH